ncbi:shikimate dehydrogenase [Rhizobium sp. Leaf341]|uniref:shikimate dehydrogenase n=1 Tax=Rhizobium sp. Leaf341 TaxID=1736344 RepID=UPI000715DCA0|nr:shikimate dehydrogenase [Rhizobium sp. Leaf341]KQR79349.1 shikimate dehydrogenase [Rhizobium sp. Leaf341]
MHDSRETFVNHAFVAGYPVRHSRSPLIHTHWLKTLGLQGSYSTREVPPALFSDFMTLLRLGQSGFIGGNVTIPHKEAVIACVDDADALSREIGAANTVWLEEGRLKATNTDGLGFAANLDERAPGWEKAETAIVLGAGGASRAVIQAVRDRGVRTIHVVNRTLPRAQELSHRFGRARVIPHGMEALPELLPDASLFINTTSLGMDGAAVPDFDFTNMPSGAIVTDIVYVPLVTPILAQAKAQGYTIVDGLGMLLHQAAPGFQKWFGQKPIVDETLRKLVIGDMAAHA